MQFLNMTRTFLEQEKRWTFTFLFAFKWPLCTGAILNIFDKKIHNFVLVWNILCRAHIFHLDFNENVDENLINQDYQRVLSKMKNTLKWKDSFLKWWLSFRKREMMNFLKVKANFPPAFRVLPHVAPKLCFSLILQ